MAFRYCPKCGGGLRQSKRDGETVPTCQRTRCGFRFWQNSKPCVLGLIFNEHGEVLMTIRAIAPERGKLDLPGGFLRAGELPADGVKRELREELGVDVLPGASVGYAIDRYYDQGRYEYILSVAFTVRIVRGEPTVADRREIAGLKWVDPSRVEAASLAFAGNETFLAMCRDGHIVRT